MMRVRNNRRSFGAGNLGQFTWHCGVNRQRYRFFAKDVRIMYSDLNPKWMNALVCQSYSDFEIKLWTKRVLIYTPYFLHIKTQGFLERQVGRGETTLAYVRGSLRVVSTTGQVEPGQAELTKMASRVADILQRSVNVGLVGITAGGLYLGWSAHNHTLAAGRRESSVCSQRSTHAA